MPLTDRDGRKLENGYYVARRGYVCRVKVSGDSFSVEHPLDGFLPITDFEEAARNFTRIEQPECSARFILQESAERSA